MPLGLHTVDFATTTPNNYVGDLRTLAQRGSFNTNVSLRSVLVRFMTMTSGAAVMVKPVVWSVSSGLKVGEGLTTQVNPTNNTTYHELAFSSPVALTAGTQYYIGTYQSQANNNFVGTYSTAGMHVHTSTLAGTTFSDATNVMYWSNGDSLPQTTYSNETTFQLSFDPPNALPNAPTGLSTPTMTEGTQGAVSWTHNDPDSNPQAKYQLRWRRDF